jgi:hypothetical protein
MRGKERAKVVRSAALGTLSLFLAIAVMAQEQPVAALDAGYRDMYNLQFQDAHKVFREWERGHPEDPLGPASDAAAYLFSEFDRLHVLETELFTDDTRFENRADLVPDANAKAAFQEQLAKAQQIADGVLAQDANNANALFAEVLVRGLRGDYAALVEKREIAGLSDMKEGRKLAEHLLASNPTYYDAYLAVGIENYLLSLKWAPVRWLLRLTGAQTDKETGLRQLRLTAEKGHYLKPYARLLLAVAALRDGNRDQARTLLDGLSREFPLNRLYAKELAKLQ